MGKHDELTKYIKIRGAREHNLKGIDIDIPRDEFVVLTGLSGSGKSSLAFDTIYAEGQRRYMESLSSYARMFLGRMEKPNVESIEGLSPAISIDQKSTNRNPRSTVGTVTEIYDYFRLLYARIGIPHCPKCGQEIKRQTVDQIVDEIMTYPQGTRLQLLAPVVRGRKGEHAKVFASAKKSGYVRVVVDGHIYDLSEEIKLEKNKKHNIEILVDRLVVREGIEKRLADSIESVMRLSDGLLIVDIPGDRQIDFSLRHTAQVCQRMQRCHQTDTLPGQHSLTELHLVHTIVNHHFQIVHLNNLVPQMRQHGKGEVTMRNGTLKRTFGFGAFCVNVNPLMIQRGIRKEIDTFLT